jgi:hypothetical protein
MRSSTLRSIPTSPSPSTSTDAPSSSPLPSNADLELAVVEDDDEELPIDLDEEVVRLSSSDEGNDGGDRHDRRKAGKKKRGRFSLLELGRRNKGKYSQVTAAVEPRPAPTALPVSSSHAPPSADTSTPSALSSVRSCLTVFNCCLCLVLSSVIFCAGYVGWAIRGQRESALSAEHRRLVVVSVDGFRPSYFTDWPAKHLTPNIDGMRAAGVSAARLTPVFPSSTFPNHWSLVTGLYPPAHGIIANQFLNRTSGEWFRRGSTSNESHCTAHHHHTDAHSLSTHPVIHSPFPRRVCPCQGGRVSPFG